MGNLMEEVNRLEELVNLQKRSSAEKDKLILKLRSSPRGENNDNFI